MKERLSGWFWPMLAINAHIEIVLWWVTPGLPPLGHSTTPREGKNSVLLENTRTHLQAHTRTICALSSIEPSHPDVTLKPDSHVSIQRWDSLSQLPSLSFCSSVYNTNSESFIGSMDLCHVSRAKHMPNLN